MVSPSVLPPDRRRQRRGAPSDYIAVPGHEPVQHGRDVHDLQPQSGQAGTGGHPGVQLRHEHAYLQRLRVQLQQPPPERIGRVRRMDGPAQHRGHLRPGEPERIGSERPLFRHQLPARRPVLRRAQPGHPIPPRLQDRWHAAAEVGPRVQRHVSELRRQRNPGGLERAGLGVPERPADGSHDRPAERAGHAVLSSGGTSSTSRSRRASALPATSSRPRRTSTTHSTDRMSRRKRRRSAPAWGDRTRFSRDGCSDW